MIQNSFWTVTINFQSDSADWLYTHTTHINALVLKRYNDHFISIKLHSKTHVKINEKERKWIAFSYRLLRHYNEEDKKLHFRFPCFLFIFLNQIYLVKIHDSIFLKKLPRNRTKICKHYQRGVFLSFLFLFHFCL